MVQIQDRHGEIVPIRALLDTGTSSTLLLREFVKQGSAKGYKGHTTSWMTLGGTFHTNQKAMIDFQFPEFSTDKTVHWKVHVDQITDPSKAAFDMIIGMDLMTELGIYVNTEDKHIHWEGASIPLKQRGDLSECSHLNYLFEATIIPEVLKKAETRQSHILDANYEPVDMEALTKEMKYLSLNEQSLLTQVLHKFPTLFGGGLGTLKIKPVHLEIKPDATPYHARPLPIPQSKRATTIKEINQLTGIGVLEKSYDSEWAAPTFIQPKKTGDVRILTDFRRLNAVLKRKPFPLPKISDLLQCLEGFKYATAIDLSMGYYHIPLDVHSSKLCTTILPWGKYQYKRLPMGIKNSPDIFQAIMQDILGDLNGPRFTLMIYSSPAMAPLKTTCKSSLQF